MFWKSVAAFTIALAPIPALAADSPLAALTQLVAEEKRLAEVAANLTPAQAIGTLLAEYARLYARGGPFKCRAEAIAALEVNPANRGTGVKLRPIKSGISGNGTHGFTFDYLTIAGGDPATANRRYPRASLIAAEKAFSDRAQVVGLGKASEDNGRTDAINSGPAGVKVGPAAIGVAVSGGDNGPSPVEWSADEVLVAPSGDLGITFGTIRPKQAPPPGQPAVIPFFTIWMRDGPDRPWRYVAE